MKYVCNNCNYNFHAKSASECGFCGMETIEVEKSAGELLEEIDSLLRD